MKNTETKANGIEDGDYQIVGEALGLKAGTIKMIRLGYRSDTRHIMEALRIVSEHRELSLTQLKKKLSKLNKKNLTRQTV